MAKRSLKNSGKAVNLKAAGEQPSFSSKINSAASAPPAQFGQVRAGETGLAQEPLSPACDAPTGAVMALMKAAAAPAAPSAGARDEGTEVKLAVEQVKVSFILFEPAAKTVSLCGEFNNWSPEATPMTRHSAGHWMATLVLAPGRYEYKFIVDGQWIPDPLALENVWNSYCTLNSVIEVSK